MVSLLCSLAVRAVERAIEPPVRDGADRGRGRPPFVLSPSKHQVQPAPRPFDRLRANGQQALGSAGALREAARAFAEQDTTEPSQTPQFARRRAECPEDPWCGVSFTDPAAGGTAHRSCWPFRAVVVDLPLPPGVQS